MDGIRKGGVAENAALKEVYLANRSLILTFINKNNGSEAEAKDVFQESIIAFFENVKAGKFKGDSSISSYLYSIARFNWLNRLKRKKVEKRIIDTQEPDDKVDSHVAVLIEKEKEQQVLQVFNQVGKTCEKVLLYSIYYNYSMKDIMANTNLSNEQVVRNRKYLCLKKLKELIKKEPTMLAFLNPNYEVTRR